MLGGLDLSGSCKGYPSELYENGGKGWFYVPPVKTCFRDLGILGLGGVGLLQDYREILAMENQTGNPTENDVGARALYSGSLCILTVGYSRSCP